MAPKANRETPFTEQERRFFAAIDRISAGKPNNKALQPAALKGKKLRLTMTSMSLEAGYARSYVYKNEEAMVRVMARFEELTKPRAPAATTADVIKKLRDANAKLRRERDLAIDVTRRWIQEADRRMDRVASLEELRDRQAKTIMEKDKTIRALEDKHRNSVRDNLSERDNVIDLDVRRTDG